MAENTPPPPETRLPERADEARHLVEEGLEERRSGNAEEADFLINEAQKLDRAAAQDTLKREKTPGA